MRWIATFAALSLAALFLTTCAAATDGPSLNGRWSGVVDAPGERTPLLLDFTTDQGRTTAVMTVPSGRLMGKGVGRVVYRAPAIGFDLPAHDKTLHFDGRVEGDAMIGALGGAGVSIPLRLTRSGPVPAAPYREIPVEFRSGDVMLHGSLLLPPGAGAHPAVVLVHGSSTPDRNDWRWYADLYARNGVAAFIYDKRDTGSEQDGGTASLETLAGDVRAAVAALKARPDIDAARIGLWGFSQGGWVVPMVAADQDFAFVIACSGPGVTYAELTRYADAERLRRTGFTPVEIADAGRFQERQDALMRAGADPAALQALTGEARSHRWFGKTTFDERPTAADRTATLRWRDLDLNPDVYWSRVRAPVFLAFGATDDVVPPAESTRRVTAALARGGHATPTARTYAGAGHDLTAAKAFPDEMLAWTLAVLRR
jgi:dienelactone hydrolase